MIVIDPPDPDRAGGLRAPPQQHTGLDGRRGTCERTNACMHVVCMYAYMPTGVRLQAPMHAGSQQFFAALTDCGEMLVSMRNRARHVRVSFLYSCRVLVYPGDGAHPDSRSVRFSSLQPARLSHSQAHASRLSSFVSRYTHFKAATQSMFERVLRLTNDCEQVSVLSSAVFTHVPDFDPSRRWTHSYTRSISLAHAPNTHPRTEQAQGR
jgi:hypothetical protein